MTTEQVRYILSQIKMGADGKHCTIYSKTGQNFGGMVWELDRRGIPSNLIQLDTEEISYYIAVEDIYAISAIND